MLEVPADVTIVVLGCIRKQTEQADKPHFSMASALVFASPPSVMKGDLGLVRRNKPFLLQVAFGHGILSEQ